MSNVSVKSSASRALRLLAAAANIRKSIGAQLSEGDRLVLSDLREHIRASLDAAVAEAMWQEGSRLPVASLIVSALQLLEREVFQEEEQVAGQSL
jgi:hypothetical protein